MRILYVVQRYGDAVAGGAELHCRQLATRLASAGHTVEVVTSCAVDYVTWANELAPGTTVEHGVTVHRLPVLRPRDDRLFTEINARVVWGSRPVPLHLQEHWMRAQGPHLTEIGPWLGRRAGAYDVVVFVTYLYWPTWAGLAPASAAAPTVLHPTAHDEPPLYLDLFRTMFRHPTGFAFLTEEEAELVSRRFPVLDGRVCEVVGVGVEAAAPGGDGAGSDGGSSFRARFGLGDRPYLLFIGRVEPGKGSEEIASFFAAYKARNPSSRNELPLALVVVGDPVRPLDPHPDMIVTGFVDDAQKASALDGALALVQPSYFESFSMVLAEAWAAGTPALVQGHCEVLAGQCRRSGGGIPYRGYAEFEAAVDLLAGDPALRRRMGAAGRRYVSERYSWGAVLGRYEGLLAAVAARRRTPPTGARRCRSDRPPVEAARSISRT